MHKLSLFAAAALLVGPYSALAQGTASGTTTTTSDQKTYTEDEIRQSVQVPKGPTTDVRRVGQANQSTLDKAGPAKTQSTSTDTTKATPVPTPK